MTFEEWLQHGIQNKWCSPPTCGMHDGGFFTIAEELELDEGYDPCYTVVRLFSDADEFQSASENNPITFRGLS